MNNASGSDQGFVRSTCSNRFCSEEDPCFGCKRVSSEPEISVDSYLFGVGSFKVVINASNYEDAGRKGMLKVLELFEPDSLNEFCRVKKGTSSRGGEAFKWNLTGKVLEALGLLSSQ